MIEPACPALPMFFMSAIDESICLRYRGNSGSSQVSSPTDRAAAITCDVNDPLLPMTAVISVPSATIAAPVSVAMSTIASGLSSAASDRPSMRIRRPSASVLWFSTVLPLRATITSPSFVAVPLGMFSVMQQ